MGLHVAHTKHGRANRICRRLLAGHYRKNSFSSMFAGDCLDGGDLATYLLDPGDGFALGTAAIPGSRHGGGVTFGFVVGASFEAGAWR